MKHVRLVFFMYGGFSIFAKIKINIIMSLNLHDGVVVSTVASQQEGSRLDPHLGPFGVEFVCSPCVCVGSLRLLRLPPTVQKHAC